MGKSEALPRCAVSRPGHQATLGQVKQTGMQQGTCILGLQGSRDVLGTIFLWKKYFPEQKTCPQASQ